jgi:glycosyltransferase involved in cell wall biosynthesis
MKIGIIIICYNNEMDIDIGHCAKYLNKVKGIEICLVNNHSNDNTYDVLKEIKESCSNVSIVNIKKFKSDNAAVKAGARFMSSQFNLKHLGFVNMNMISKYDNLNILIKDIRDNQDYLLKYNQDSIDKRGIKKTMFQSLFPVMDYLVEMNIKNKYSNMNYLG